MTAITLDINIDCTYHNATSYKRRLFLFKRCNLIIFRFSKYIFNLWNLLMVYKSVSCKKDVLSQAQIGVYQSADEITAALKSCNGVTN